MGDIFFQIFLALLGIVIGIYAQLMGQDRQVLKRMLFIFGVLLFLSAGLWWGYSLTTKELAPTQIFPTTITETVGVPTIYTSTISPTASVKDDLFNPVDDLFICINESNPNGNKTIKFCWDNKLSDDYHAAKDAYHNTYGYGTFYSDWSGFYVGYELYYCPKSNGQFVDVKYYLYEWNDLSKPIINPERQFIEFSFASDGREWRITDDKQINSIHKDCKTETRNKLTPTPP